MIEDFLIDNPDAAAANRERIAKERAASYKGRGLMHERRSAPHKVHDIGKQIPHRPENGWKELIFGNRRF